MVQRWPFYFHVFSPCHFHVFFPHYSDTLFYEDFKLSHIFKKLEEFRKIDSEANLLVYVDCPEEGINFLFTMVDFCYRKHDII